MFASCLWKVTYEAINSMTAKNDPQMTLFGRKKRGPYKKNNTLFCVFACFWGMSRLQAIDLQEEPSIPSLQKKSCRKTYHRFSVLAGSDIIIA
jgi:hypothetical protein